VGASPMETTTASRQPKIVTAGVVELENGKPIIRAANTTSGMVSAFAPNDGVLNKQMLLVLKRQTIGGYQNIFGSNFNGADYGYYIGQGDASTTLNNTPQVTLERLNGAIWSYVNSGDVYDHLSSQSIISYNIDFNFGDNTLCLGYRYYNNANSPMTDIQELIIFGNQTDQISKDTSINDYYNAY
jgi:hypothetical protein